MLLAADGAGYLLQAGTTVFRQRRAGTLAWRWDLPAKAPAARRPDTWGTKVYPVPYLLPTGGESVQQIHRRIGYRVASH